MSDSPTTSNFPLCLAICSLLGLAIVCGCQRGDIANAAIGKPIRKRSIVFTPQQVQRYRSAAKPVTDYFPTKLSLIAHRIRIGIDDSLHDELVKLVLDSKKYEKRMGHPLPLSNDARGNLYYKPKGPNYPTGERHPNQILAALGKIGVLPTRQVLMGSRQHTVQDLIDGMIARLHLNQELEWTVMSICYYLPHQCSWQNRFGETITIDDLARTLLDDAPAAFTCWGTHRLYALALLAKQNEFHRGLSTRTTKRIRGELNRAAADFLRKFTAPKQLNEFEASKLAHELEWIQLLGGESTVRTSAIKRPLEQLLLHLEQSSVREHNYAGLTHLLIAIREWNGLNEVLK